jgi:hypothetical protein
VGTPATAASHGRCPTAHCNKYTATEIGRLFFAT